MPSKPAKHRPPPLHLPRAMRDPGPAVTILGDFGGQFSGANRLPHALLDRRAGGIAERGHDGLESVEATANRVR